MASLKTLRVFMFTLLCILTNGQQPTPRLNFFDIDLLKYCAEERRGNIMVSPASIKATLAMLLEGSRGLTEAEIVSALRVAPKKEDYRDQINVFLEGLKTNTTGVVLQNANSVFLSHAVKMKKDYETMLKHVYMADVLKMNFSDIDRSVNTINKWVSKNTNGLIPQIVDAANLNPSTEMLLANAMYFKGTWQRPFSPQNTESACFHDHGTCRKVQMMSLRAEMKYAYLDELRAHAVELPYEGGRYSMILLVPLDRDGCAPLIRDLPYLSLHQIIALMEPNDVQLAMPKFTIDNSENMVGTLQSMRIRSLFSPSSNLTGMFDGPSPLVDSMYHKVHMSVDEQGTVAAAATAAMVVPLIDNGVQLRVDRPFIFFIRDNSLGVVLFEGRIEEPTPFVEPVKVVTAQPAPPPLPAQQIPESLPALPSPAPPPLAPPAKPPQAALAQPAQLLPVKSVESSSSSSSVPVDQPSVPKVQPTVPKAQPSVPLADRSAPFPQSSVPLSESSIPLTPSHPPALSPLPISIPLSPLSTIPPEQSAKSHHPKPVIESLTEPPHPHHFKKKPNYFYFF